MSAHKTLVFTDMDGTLLDHDTYSFTAAQPTLAALQQRAIPVIPCTSKTFAEMVELRARIGLKGPFIVENGAAAYLPHGCLPQKPAGAIWQDGFWCKAFTSGQSHWLKLLEAVKDDFAGEFTHFNQMSIAEIQAATGLEEAEAERAAQRQFGEPILWQSDTARKQAFMQAVQARGATPLEGGRFVHVSGDCDKGRALQWLKQEYQRYQEDPISTVALGDGNNDIAMLEAADIAVRIASPSHPPPQIKKTEQVYTSTQLGPEGWTEMLTKLLALKN